MSNILSSIGENIKADAKKFWDGVFLPEVRVLEQTLENVQKELAPLEEIALKAIVGAGATAMAAAAGGAIPTSIEAAMPILEIGAKAAMAAAESQGVSLSAQAATLLMAGASAPAPTVANGANGQ